jgi:hypothetical protein
VTPLIINHPSDPLHLAVGHQHDVRMVHSLRKHSRPRMCSYKSCCHFCWLSSTDPSSRCWLSGCRPGHFSRSCDAWGSLVPRSPQFRERTKETIRREKRKECIILKIVLYKNIPLSISKQCKYVISSHGRRRPRCSVSNRLDLNPHENHLLRAVKEENTELDGRIPLPVLSSNEESSSSG